MYNLELFKNRLIEYGAKKERGDLVYANDKICIIYSELWTHECEDGEVLTLGYDNVYVSSKNGFINICFDSLLRYPEDIEQQIVWENYLIPYRIATQEEYDKVKR